MELSVSGFGPVPDGLIAVFVYFLVIVFVYLSLFVWMVSYILRRRMTRSMPYRIIKIFTLSGFTLGCGFKVFHTIFGYPATNLYWIPVNIIFSGLAIITWNAYAKKS